MKINTTKILSPDFFLGRLLIALRSWLDLLVLLLRYPSADSIKLAKLILQVKPAFTMVTNWNLVNLYHLVKKANQRQVPGDIVECGVWKGGSAALMATTNLEATPLPARKFWLFDSFQGLPNPGEQDGKRAIEGYFDGFCKGNVDAVHQIFQARQISRDQYQIIPGWFNETLDKAPIRQIAVLHVDADWYDSVMDVLQALYDKVVPGGYIIFDDYGYWEGCRKAVDDFLAARGMQKNQIHLIGRTGAYLEKMM